MAHNNTVFAQLLKLFPRHEFESLARRHHQGRALRRTSRWDQCVALMGAQLTGRRSLRDVCTNLSAQGAHLYHLGTRGIARSSLARLNAQQPYTLYEALFAKLYSRCQGLTRPGHGFRFKHPLYSLDASLIDLSLKVFPWAHYALGKAALKLHLGLDHKGYMPAFATITESKCHESRVARHLDLPAGSMLVFDKGYTDYAWYKALTEKRVYFVTRQRTNALYTVIERRPVDPSSGLTCDQTIRLTGKRYQALELPELRRIGYRDPDTGRHYVFLTNAYHLSAATIAKIYKARWQIELFFKWIKQNLQIKAFLGTSRNALLTQIWVALCVNLLLAYLKFSARIQWSMQQILRLLHLNLFARRDLIALLSRDPPRQPPTPQLALL